MAPSTSTTAIPLNKRFLSLLLAFLGLLLLLSLTFSRTHTPTSSSASSLLADTYTPSHVSASVLKGETIASGKIENATAKAELGRAAWKLFHTTMAKFPDRPGEEEQVALSSYIYLFARLYPWYGYPFLLPAVLMSMASCALPEVICTRCSIQGNERAPD